jgi:dTDP-glucose 4,6-dehydratase
MEKSMNLLVTGGSGFIGSNFIRLLLTSSLGDSITRLVNLDRLTYAGNPENLSGVDQDPRYVFVEGDIGDGPLLARLLVEHEIQAVVNFAAESHVDRSIDGPEAFVRTNVLGTFHLLDESRNYWKALSGARQAEFRFLHVSTDEVFGSLSETDPAFSETTPYAPNSPYSASKAGADHLVRAYFHTFHLPVLTTNCSNNYGPRQFPEKLIPLMILNARAGKPLPVYGDGLNVRDWLYVDDHARAIWRVLTAGTCGETYNIGGWNEIKNIDIVTSLCSLLDEMVPGPAPRAGLITHVKDRPGHDRRYAMDCRKIERTLGWKPEETFTTGLRKTVRWYLDNPEWCDNIRTQKYRGERLGQA